MVLDVISILVLLAFFMNGYSKGLIVAVFSVVSILLGVICAMKLSHEFATWLLEKGYVSSGWAQGVAYLVLFIGVVIIVRLLARIIERAVENMMLGMLNNLIGAVLYTFMGAVIWSSLLWIGTRLHIITGRVISESHTYGFLSQIAPWFFSQVGKVLPFARDTFEGLEHYFNSINSK